MGFILLALIIGSILILFATLGVKIKSRLGIVIEIFVSILSIIFLFLYLLNVFSGEERYFGAFLVVFFVTGLLAFPLSYYEDKRFSTKNFVSIIVGATLVFAIALGIGSGCGFEEVRNEKQTIELIEINFGYDDKTSFYVYEEDYNYICLKLNSITNKFEKIKIPKDKVSFEESEECDNPRLVEYERDAKKTFWSMGFNTKTEYVFYVPTGSVAKELF